MDRTGAFDRSLIMLVSPTGTGYVNYFAVAAAQYLTRGDVATVTMQYSKRPSPLSLGKVKDAREQNRLLWLRILERLRDRPGGGRGSSSSARASGAHTSQDVFLHWGTLGLRGAGHRPGAVDRHPVRQRVDARGHRPATGSTSTPTSSPSSTTSGSSRTWVQQRRSRLRYVLVSHDNDGVTKFGPDLLARRRAWLGAGRPRPEPCPAPARAGSRPTCAGARSPPSSRCSIDMKNAQIPGAYRAWAHDYRPDLARFVSEVFDLPASPEQLAAIEPALERRETAREELFTPKPAVPAG